MNRVFGIKFWSGVCNNEMTESIFNYKNVGDAVGSGRDRPFVSIEIRYLK